MRGVQTALMAWAFGLLFTSLLGPPTPHHTTSRRLAWWLSWAAWLVALARLADMAWRLPSLSAAEPSVLLVAHTYVGQVLLTQIACLSLVLVSLWRARAIKLGLCWMVLAMLCTALAGHVTAAAEGWQQIVLSLMHVLLAQLWLAGVWGLWWRSRHTGDAIEAWRQPLARFSKLALPGMLLLLMSGVGLAYGTVGSWPALLATAYGQQLLIKSGLVLGALVCAWQLRQWLVRPGDTGTVGRAWLSSEGNLALAVLFAASVMAATVPAAHDTIVWPFSFRWAPVLAWRQDPTGTGLSLAWAVGWCVLGGICWAVWRRGHRHRAHGALVAGILGGLVVGLPATSISAYPTTYMHSSARLDAASVSAGEELYGQHCLACHGVHGHGDGPVAALNQLKPANLTEPHVSWHTHGDMFWWLSHGKGNMPGFGDVLSTDERWHLINWLIAMSLGYEGRTLTSQPAPFNPWLPSIDFRFQMDNNNFMSLSEWRGLHAVHLVIVNQESQLQRVRDLLQDMKGFPAQLVIVSRPAWLKDLVKGPCEAILVSDPQGEIAQAWANYRRSFASPDLLNEETQVPRMEFLIDRYGFVRARWRSDESPSALSVSELKAVYDSLSVEGEIKSAAIHQHD